MTTVTFVSMDAENRTATFDVDGAVVTRNIPAQYAGTIDDYLTALSNGLLIEFSSGEKGIEETSYKSGQVLGSIESNPE